MLRLLYPCLSLMLFATVVVGNDMSEYESRQGRTRALAFANTAAHGGCIQIVQAFLNQSIDQQAVDKLLVGLDQDRDAAMSIVILIRILLLTDDVAVQRNILDALGPIPFWLTPGEVTRVYWSENQQIMWMSSSWLLRERYPDAMAYDEPTLRQRLVHYLNLKNKYGFFEFFSSVYLPYTLQGLLNLADFCDDDEIRALAVQATEKLLSTILLMANGRGSFFAAAGRNYVEFYLQRRAITGVIWMLTGLGEEHNYLHHVTCFLATSGLEVSSVVGNYSTSLQETVPVRPSLGESFGIDGGLDRLDRTIINQWGMGAYFHPDAAEDTQYALDALDLWDHDEFAQFASFSGLPSFVGSLGSELLASITKSSVLTGHDVEVFRDGDVVLSSVQAFWPGHLGYQVYPWVATTGTKAVWTQTGEVVPDWLDRPGTPSNTHLPFMKQKENMALLTYNPKDDLERIEVFAPDSPLGVDYYEVALHWPNGFDAEKEVGPWKFGQEGEGYVAVARHCLNTINGIPACNDEGQAWAVIVGNSALYNSFDGFVNRIAGEAVFVSEWRSEFSWGWPFFKRYFYGQVQFDGIQIENMIDG